MKRGSIYMADLGQSQGSEQGGRRPVLIVSNDKFNGLAPVLNIIPLTSKMKNSPVHVLIEKNQNPESGLIQDSMALTEQIRTIDKSRLKNKIGFINEEIKEKINRAIAIQNDMKKPFDENYVLDTYRKIVNFKKLINYNVPALMIKQLKQPLIAELKKYCERYNKDYKQTVEEILKKIGKIAACAAF